jgi:hypothetical protein
MEERYKKAKETRKRNALLRGYPIVYNSQECYTNGIPVNCSELNYTPQGGWDEKIKKG